MSATSGEVPKSYFEAFADSPEEAQALYNLSQNRAAWQRSQQAAPVSEGG